MMLWSVLLGIWIAASGGYALWLYGLSVETTVLAAWLSTVLTVPAAALTLHSLRRRKKAAQKTLG